MTRPSKSSRSKLAESVDFLSSGLLMLDSQGTITHANLAAERVLARRDGLERRGHALHAVDPDDDRRFYAALARAFEVPPPFTDVALSIARTVVEPDVGERPRYQLLLLPPRQRADASAWRYVTAFVTDPTLSLSSLVPRLRELYGLSTEEAELAIDLARGARLTSSDRDAHVFALLEKTGVNNVNALARLVMAAAIVR